MLPLATAEICMKCFPHHCLRSFCQFCGQNSTFSIVFIILDNLEWYFQYFYETRLKRLFFVWDIVNERTSGTWICRPIAAFPNFTLNTPSSVIYNLYGKDGLRGNYEFPSTNLKLPSRSGRELWLVTAPSSHTSDTRQTHGTYNNHNEVNITRSIELFM